MQLCTCPGGGLSPALYRIQPAVPLQAGQIASTLLLDNLPHPAWGQGVVAPNPERYNAAA